MAPDRQMLIPELGDDTDVEDGKPVATFFDRRILPVPIAILTVFGLIAAAAWCFCAAEAVERLPLILSDGELVEAIKPVFGLGVCSGSIAVIGFYWSAMVRLRRAKLNGLAIMAQPVHMAPDLSKGRHEKSGLPRVWDVRLLLIDRPYQGQSINWQWTDRTVQGRRPPATRQLYTILAPKRPGEPPVCIGETFEFKPFSLLRYVVSLLVCFVMMTFSVFIAIFATVEPDPDGKVRTHFEWSYHSGSDGDAGKPE